MTESATSHPPDHPEPQAELLCLKKIIQVLMDRSERSTRAVDSDYGSFQRTIMLEGQVRLRTAALEGALKKNEKMTRALRESEARLRGLVSQSLVGIVLIEDGKFGYSNAKFDDIFGYSARGVRDLEPLEVAAECDRESVAAKIAERLNGATDQLSYPSRRPTARAAGTSSTACARTVTSWISSVTAA